MSQSQSCAEFALRWFVFPVALLPFSRNVLDDDGADSSSDQSSSDSSSESDTSDEEEQESLYTEEEVEYVGKERLTSMSFCFNAV